MLESTEKNAGKFSAKANLYRFRMYTRFYDSKFYEPSEWGGGTAWEPNKSLANPGPTRTKISPTRDLPQHPTNKDIEHHFYVFARRSRDIESTLLFEQRARHMSLSSLPVNFGNTHWEFAVLGLPHRLTPAGIAKLQKRAAHVLNYHSIGEEKKFDDGAGLEVVFPYMIARSMAQQVHEHNRIIQKLTAGRSEYKALTNSEFETPTGGYKRFRLAEVIHELLQDDDLRHDLSDAIGENTSKKVARIVHRRRADVSRHARTAEKIGADFVAWYGSELFEIIVDECLLEDPGLSQMVDELGYLTTSLNESTAGTVRLAAYARGDFPDSFLHKGFVDVPEPGSDAFKRVRHKAKVSANIFNAIHGAHAFLGHSDAQKYIDKFDNWIGNLLQKREWKTGLSAHSYDVNHTLASGSSRKSLTRVRARVEKVLIDAKRLDELEEFLLDEVTEGKAAFEEVVLGFDAINTALALHAVFEASSKDTTKLLDAELTAASSLLSLAGKVLATNIDELPSAWSKATAKGVTNLGALYYAYKNYNAGSAAQDLGDSDAAVVMYTAASAEAISFVLAVGSVFVAEGSLAAAALGPIGAVLGAVGGLCYLIYDTIKDSHLALAVKYTKYGSLADQQLPEFAHWSSVSPADMRVSTEKALLGIEFGLRQFTLGTGSRPDEEQLKTISLPRIYVGHIDGNTHFHVRWDVTLNGSPVAASETWTPYGDDDRHGHTTRPYYHALKIDEETGELYFDARLPSGFAIVSQGKFSGEVGVQKSFFAMDRRQILPPPGPVVLRLHTTMTTEGDKRFHSSEVVPPKQGGKDDVNRGEPQ